MLYRVETTIKSLEGGHAYVLQSLNSITGDGEKIGPSLSFRGLPASRYADVAPALPDVPDYELKVQGERLSGFDALSQILARPGKYDRVLAFFDDRGSLEIDLANPNTASPRIVVSFTTPADPEEENRPIPFDRLLPPREREQFAEILIQQEASHRGVAPDPATIRELSRVLVHAPSSRFANKPFREEGTGAEYQILVGDDARGINHAFSVIPPAREAAAIFDSFAKIVHQLPRVKCWRALLHGEPRRIATAIDLLPGIPALLGFGDTLPRQDELRKLEVENEARWREELRRAVLPQEAVGNLLGLERGMEYKNLALKWINLGTWIVSPDGKMSPPDDEAWSENGIELTKSKKGAPRLYLSIGDSLPRRQIKPAIEKVLGVRLKPLS